MHTRRSLMVFALLTGLVLLPSAAFAQNAEIAGVVRDSSGAVLPGVTVEASSPALIEQSRTVYTDGQGQYRVIALSPGTYRVTFTLSGFKTLVREGIVLTAEFTATIEATMAVGGLAETITVSGQTPLVDIQATTQRRALTAELLYELPTGRSFQNLAILVPGVQMPLGWGQDVGGSGGALMQTLKVHGSRDDQMPLLMNGLAFNVMNNTGGGYNHTFAVNMGTVQEMTVTTSGSTSEVRVSGVVANTVAKEGSNKFSYAFYGDFSSSGLQWGNLTQELRDRGLTAVNHIKELRELNPTIGGPIIRDRLWFYGGFRYLRSTRYLADSFLTKDPLNPQYCNKPLGCLYGYETIGLGLLGGTTLVPDSRDLTKEDFSGDTFHRTYTGNLTWQIDKKNKASFFYHLGRRNLVFDSYVSQTPETSPYLYSAPAYIAQGHWTNPLTSKLLLEGGVAFVNQTRYSLQRPEFGLPGPGGQGPDFPVAKYELSIPAVYGPSASNQRLGSHQYNMRFAANYVTGSHAFKFGMQDMWGTRNFSINNNNSQFWYFLNGAPVGILELGWPKDDLEHLKASMGVFAQDRWTVKRVTMNLGVRFDYHNAYVPAQDTPANPFITARHYDALVDVPSWKDLSPRLGFAWDTTGKGRTVVRFNYGHYLANESVATATANNPVNTRVNFAFRPWLDFNGNFTPDCNLANPGANGECFALNAPLGNPDVVTHWDPNVLRGWGVRPSDDEILVGLQQQLRERLTLDVQWTRHSFGNLFATERRAMPPSAYDSFCVTAPKDSRLPGSGGNQVCGFVDLKPEYTTVTPDDFITSADKFGKVTDLYTGFDVTLTVRFAKGGQASGGISSGRERTDYCNVAGLVQIGSNTDTTAGKIFLDNYVGNWIDNTGPSASAYPSKVYCAVTPPFQPDWKALVTYPLRWGLNVSATWQNRAGPQILASQAASLLSPSLNRLLTSPNAYADLISPGTLYDNRLNQVDVRLAKSVKVGGGRLQGTVSVFNLLNGNKITLLNTQYGTSWLQPLQIMQGRLVKFGAQFDF